MTPYDISVIGIPEPDLGFFFISFYISYPFHPNSSVTIQLSKPENSGFDINKNNFYIHLLLLITNVIVEG